MREVGGESKNDSESDSESEPQRQRERRERERERARERARDCDSECGAHGTVIGDWLESCDTSLQQLCGARRSHI